MNHAINCKTCGQSFLPASKYIKHCSIACLPDRDGPRMCRVCGVYFKPKSASQIFCSNIECQRASVKERERTRTKRSEALSLEAIKSIDKSPFKPCVSCAHWKKMPSGQTDMGGQCIAELFNKCKPWSEAKFYKEAQ